MYRKAGIFKVYGLVSFERHTHTNSRNHSHDQDSEHTHRPQKLPPAALSHPAHYPEPRICVLWSYTFGFARLLRKCSPTARACSLSASSLSTIASMFIYVGMYIGGSLLANAEWH